MLFHHGRLLLQKTAHHGQYESKRVLKELKSLRRVSSAHRNNVEWGLVRSRYDDRRRSWHVRTIGFKLALIGAKCSDHAESNGIGTLLESAIGSIWSSASSWYASYSVQLGHYEWLASNECPYESTCTCHGLTAPVARNDARHDAPVARNDARHDALVARNDARHDATESVHGL